MMSRHRTQGELRSKGDDVALRRPVVDPPVSGGPLRPDDKAEDAGVPDRRTATCPVCASPVAVEGFCMSCWEVC